SAVTDLNGNFSFNRLLAGSYEVSVSVLGFQGQMMTVPVGAGSMTAADFGLMPVGRVGTLSGRITNAIDGKPLAGTPVDDFGPRRQVTPTDANGNYFLDELIPGTYRLTVRAEAYTDTSRDGVSVPACSLGLQDLALPPVRIFFRRRLPDIAIPNLSPNAITS